jgi:hypothetical protein
MLAACKIAYTVVCNVFMALNGPKGISVGGGNDMRVRDLLQIVPSFLPSQRQWLRPASTEFVYRAAVPWRF